MVARLPETEAKMFRQREIERGIQSTHDRKMLMYSVLKHHMNNKGLSDDTLRHIWNNAKMHRIEIEYEDKH